MNPRILTTALIGLIGLIIAMVPENTTKQFQLTASELIDEMEEGSEYIHPDELAEWLINKDPSIQLIDIRTPIEFEKFHLDNAINIPLSQLLKDEWVDYLNQGVKMNILYSNGNTLAHDSWMILRQFGYDNNYVLQGGLNYWTETILNPTSPPPHSPNDELAKYEFRKGASGYFGGSTVSKTQTTNKKTTKPKIKRSFPPSF